MALCLFCKGEGYGHLIVIHSVQILPAHLRYMPDTSHLVIGGKVQLNSIKPFDPF